MTSSDTRVAASGFCVVVCPHGRSTNGSTSAASTVVTTSTRTGREARRKAGRAEETGPSPGPEAEAGGESLTA